MTHLKKRQTRGLGIFLNPIGNPAVYKAHFLYWKLPPSCGDASCIEYRLLSLLPTLSSFSFLSRRHNPGARARARTGFLPKNVFPYENYSHMKRERFFVFVHARALHTVFQRINILVAKQEQNRHCACAAADRWLVKLLPNDLSCKCLTIACWLIGGIFKCNNSYTAHTQQLIADWSNCCQIICSVNADWSAEFWNATSNILRLRSTCSLNGQLWFSICFNF